MSIPISCGTCFFWIQHSFRGSCNRYPPVPAVGAGNIRPVTDANEWCGEHRDPPFVEPRPKARKTAAA